MLVLKKDTNIIIDSHSERVESLAVMVCDKLQISLKEKESITISARLHDIGKSIIDKEILNKPGKLNELEWHQMRKHAKFGYIIAKNLGYPESVCKNILYHHENYDGTGYYYLKNKNIPLGAGIIRICDTYDAIRAKRAYKEGRSHIETINEIIKSKKTYDEHLLEQFLKLNFAQVNYKYT